MPGSVRDRAVERLFLPRNRPASESVTAAAINENAPWRAKRSGAFLHVSYGTRSVTKQLARPYVPAELILASRLQPARIYLAFEFRPFGDAVGGPYFEGPLGRPWHGDGGNEALVKAEGPLRAVYAVQVKLIAAVDEP